MPSPSWKRRCSNHKIKITGLDPRPGGDRHINNSGYPFIDADNGGSLDGVIAFCEAVLAEIDEDTIVIPGHGAVAAYGDLQNYVHMLKTIRGEILVKAGRSLEEIKAAGITRTWDEQMGNPASFLDRSWVSLTRRYLP